MRASKWLALALVPACTSGGNSGGTSESAATSASSAEAEAEAEVESGAESESTSESGSNFVGLDAGPGCGDLCDIWDPDSCPAGEKCTTIGCEAGVIGWDTNVCRPVMGDKLPGEACSSTGAHNDGDDDCAAGSICFGVDVENQVGVCLEFCGSEFGTPTCPEGFGCPIGATSVLPLCLPGCDPLEQDCTEGWNCNPVLGAVEAFVCAPGRDSKAFGEPCTYVNDCAPGLLCVETWHVPGEDCDPLAADGCCTSYCDVNDPSACMSTGQTCRAVFEPGTAPEGFEDVGLCSLT